MRQIGDKDRTCILILVDEVVAVEHVNTIPGSVVSFNQHNFVNAEPNDVLQAGRFLEHVVSYCFRDAEKMYTHKAQLLDHCVG